ncbi:aldolase/citrate lyase family protein [Kineosporia mesophila]|uniref:Aldolase/citrate lyase family protein n=1 Tax=Kineosporia mesophila TaxID=566012 RepID=A0ABP7A975_9ACTN|nr:aldolase/citrate lyase family protein [Kineosporia mesophila]MCD5355144.1 aldolase/citrate lyase family protein [Kineosporia mesophila]
MTVTDFAARVRRRETVVGYWILLDAPPATERIATLGYDYVALDAQHGLFGYSGLLNGLTAIDAGGASAGVVRVGQNGPAEIGRALDAGARAVIVPLVNTAQDAADAVAAARYPPHGIRSYGPMRSLLRIGPEPARANDSVAVLAMIETPQGLQNVEEIAATPGLDGLYVGPSDLTLSIGGTTSTDPAVADEFETALTRIRTACEANGLAAGLHTGAGEVAARRIAEGWTVLTVACDLVHLEIAARDHLAAARGDR